MPLFEKSSPEIAALLEHTEYYKEIGTKTENSLANHIFG